MDELIWKQDALDALMAERKHLLAKGQKGAEHILTHHGYNVIDELPTVQPKRTCVNCGRTVNNGGWYADGGTRCPIEEHYALPKDGYCHLWEKRNVTDDDYPERRTDERTDSETGCDGCRKPGT